MLANNSLRTAAVSAWTVSTKRFPASVSTTRLMRRGPLHAETIGELGLGQWDWRLGCDRNGHPAGLAHTEVLQAPIDRLAPDACGSVQHIGKPFFELRHYAVA
jgi:hypothetical protein